MIKIYKSITYIILLFLLLSFGSAIEFGDDSYFCEEGEVLRVQDAGIFSNGRWRCVDLDNDYCQEGGDCTLNSLTVTNFTVNTTNQVNVTGNITADWIFAKINFSFVQNWEEPIFNFINNLFFNKTESDDRYVNVDGDTMTGNLTLPNLFIDDGVIYLNSGKEHRLSNGCVEIINGIASESFCLWHEEVHSAGTIADMLIEGMDISNLKIIRASQVGKNNSVSIHGNSQMIINNKLCQFDFFNNGSHCNMTTVTDIFKQYDYWNVTPFLAADTATDGASLVVQGKVDIWNTARFLNGLLGFNSFDWNLQGNDANFFAGAIHNQIPVNFTTGFNASQPLTLVQEDFEGGIGIFNNDPNNINNWITASSNKCEDGLCVSAQGGAGSVLMNTTFSTVNINATELNFFYSLTGLVGADSIDVYGWNGSIEEILFTDSGTDTDVEVNIALDNGYWNKTEVTIRVECTAQLSTRFCYFDTFKINGTASATTIQNQTGFDVEICGADCQRGPDGRPNRALIYSAAQDTWFFNGPFNGSTTGGGGGITQHSLLSQLDFASSGHTGFASQSTLDSLNQTVIDNNISMKFYVDESNKSIVNYTETNYYGKTHIDQNFYTINETNQVFINVTEADGNYWKLNQSNNASGNNIINGTLSVINFSTEELGGDCSGTVSQCNAFNGDQTGCNNQAGCSYNNPFPGNCGGVATECDAITARTTCESQVGCLWELYTGVQIYAEGSTNLIVNNTLSTNNIIIRTGNVSATTYKGRGGEDSAKLLLNGELGVTILTANQYMTVDSPLSTFFGDMVVTGGIVAHNITFASPVRLLNNDTGEELFNVSEERIAWTNDYCSSNLTVGCLSDKITSNSLPTIWINDTFGAYTDSNITIGSNDTSFGLRNAMFSIFERSFSAGNYFEVDQIRVYGSNTPGHFPDLLFQSKGYDSGGSIDASYGILKMSNKNTNTITLDALTGTIDTDDKIRVAGGWESGGSTIDGGVGYFDTIFAYNINATTINSNTINLNESIQLKDVAGTVKVLFNASGNGFYNGGDFLVGTTTPISAGTVIEGKRDGVNTLITAHEDAGTHYAGFYARSGTKDYLQYIIGTEEIVHWEYEGADFMTYDTTTDTFDIPNGDLTVSTDTDASTILGRTRIDSRTSDQAVFSHYDMTGSGQYALKQTETGFVSLNAPSSTNIAFGFNGGTKHAIYGATNDLEIGFPNEGLYYDFSTNRTGHGTDVPLAPVHSVGGSATPATKQFPVFVGENRFVSGVSFGKQMATSLGATVSNGPGIVNHSANPSGAGITTKQTTIETSTYLTGSGDGNVTIPRGSLYVKDRIGINEEEPLGMINLKGTTELTNAMIFTNTNINHGMTTTFGAGQQSTMGKLTQWSSSTGGFRIMGSTSTGGTTTPAIYIQGVHGSSAPTTPVISIAGFKKNGASSQNLAGTDALFGIYPGSPLSTTPAIFVYGNGNIGISNNTPNFKLTVEGNSSFNGQMRINQSGLFVEASGTVLRAGGIIDSEGFRDTAINIGAYDGSKIQYGDYDATGNVESQFNDAGGNVVAQTLSGSFIIGATPPPSIDYALETTEGIRAINYTLTTGGGLKGNSSCVWIESPNGNTQSIVCN